MSVRITKKLSSTRRKALLAVVLISSLIFLLTLTGNPYVALSRYLFEAKSTLGQHSSRTVFSYGSDQVIFEHGRHQLYADRVNQLSDASVSIIYRSGASLQVTANCSRTVHLGESTNSSWMLCTAGTFKPQPPCFAISFDINEQWSIEASELAIRFGCQALVFDPTIAQTEKSRVNNRVFYLREGLKQSKTTVSRPKDAYLGHLKRLGAENLVIDVLEVNLGVSGWEAVDEAIADESVRNVKQLLLAVPIGQNVSVEMMRGEMGVISRLDQVGFQLWHYRQRTLRSSDGKLNLLCQFHFINKNFAANDVRARNSDAGLNKVRDSLRQLTRTVRKLVNKPNA
ncbi:hypothetical protein BOX15_Mlig002328g2 [Macrostomum lignano]|uniref:Methyltransferase domain-containing protein n=1 Tax=Macrostomum lignano TaxID=282301 RepID=A0A267DRV6_9PLAT|nr:hypothetical protein BOX15_Mlig002328g2 [Macrostomum lignano]